MKKSIPNFEGYYSVNESGQIFTDKTGYEKKKQIYFGYENVGLWAKGVNKTIRVHRAVALAFIPNPENKPDINHIDGNKINNHVSNLEWCTKKENNQHSRRLGLQKTLYGERTSAAKLSNVQVLAIKDAISKGFKNKQIASYFRVDPSTISHIKIGKTRIYA